MRPPHSTRHPSNQRLQHQVLDHHRGDHREEHESRSAREERALVAEEHVGDPTRRKRGVRAAGEVVLRGGGEGGGGGGEVSTEKDGLEDGKEGEEAEKRKEGLAAEEG